MGERFAKVVPLIFGISQLTIPRGRVTQGDIHEDLSSTVGSSSLWSKGLGGIAGRGVLVDYAGWASENGVKYDALSTQHIPLEAVKLIAREKGVEFRQGDILFLRTGKTGICT